MDKLNGMNDEQKETVLKIAAALREELDGLTYRFKSTDEPNDATETKPRVYTFTYDGELDRDLLPVHTPSVLLRLAAATEA